MAIENAIKLKTTEEIQLSSINQASSGMHLLPDKTEAQSRAKFIRFLKQSLQVHRFDFKMKFSVSLVVCVLTFVIVPNVVEGAGLFEAVQAFKPCLDKANQRKISLVAALTAPEDWYEKCFIACLAKKMGNVSEILVTIERNFKRLFRACCGKIIAVTPSSMPVTLLEMLSKLTMSMLMLAMTLTTVKPATKINFKLF